MEVQKNDGLIKEAESHIVVGLFGLLLLGFLLSSSGRRSTATGGSCSRGSGATATTTTGWHGGQLAASLGDQRLEILSSQFGNDLVK
jgi:hypothetical protein